MKLRGNLFNLTYVRSNEKPTYETIFTNILLYRCVCESVVLYVVISVISKIPRIVQNEVWQVLTGY